MPLSLTSATPTIIKPTLLARIKNGLRFGFITIALLSTSACIYKLDVQQGNLIEESKVERLKLGMTQQQVSLLLGTPMLVDPFHQDRWDYYAWSKTGRKEQIIRRQLSLIFKDKLLVEIR